MKSNRRNFLKITSLTGIGLAGTGMFPTLSEEQKTDSGSLPQPQTASAFVPLNRFPQMVHEYFVNRLRQFGNEAARRRSAISSKNEAEAYVNEVRGKIQNCFGPWPEKTPLNARITKKLERDTYTVENVIFESRPGYPVTANLYIPKKRKFPLPAVIGVCGHNDSGKAGNQSFGQGLARLGYVSLVFDPAGQGERLQFPTIEGKSRIGIGVLEHLYTGNPLFLLGDSLSAWSVWDGIRAVDYLLSRKEVDPRHIGITGVSGGGTQTTWICSADPRITMAAPACFVTTFLTNLENEEVADTEQVPPRAIAMGLDHSDFLAAMAPNPVIILSQENDFFDVRGAEESFARLKPLYNTLGFEQNVQLNVGPGGHSYPKESREAMYAHFNRATKISKTNTEPELTVEKQEDLWCTPRGQVGETGARTIYSFRKEASVALKAKRSTLQGEKLKQAVLQVLKLPLSEGVPHFRVLRAGRNRNYPKKFAANYVVETEPGIFSIVYRLNDTVLYSRPPKGSKRAVLYVSHKSSDDELRNEPLLTEIIKNEPDSSIFTCDVRGVGESKPNSTWKTFEEPYGVDYFYAAYSIMLDYPLVGQKTFDILRVIDWLKSFGHQEVHLVAKGWGATPAAFAALISDNISQVTLKNALTSYSDIAESEEYNWPLESLLPGVLKIFDLPDCYHSLEAKKLRMIDPWDAKAEVKV
jgi:dienelactone hydrolase